jgi:hypothetical protein
VDFVPGVFGSSRLRCGDSGAGTPVISIWAVWPPRKSGNPA